MSQENNTLLIERAKEIAEEYTGTMLEKAIVNNLKSGNLEVVAQLIKEAVYQDIYEEYPDVY